MLPLADNIDPEEEELDIKLMLLPLLKFKLFNGWETGTYARDDKLEVVPEVTVEIAGATRTLVGRFDLLTCATARDVL